MLTEEEREAIDSIIKNGITHKDYATDKELQLKVTALKKCLRED